MGGFTAFLTTIFPPRKHRAPMQQSYIFYLPSQCQPKLIEGPRFNLRCPCSKPYWSLSSYFAEIDNIFTFSVAWLSVSCHEESNCPLPCFNPSSAKVTISLAAACTLLARSNLMRHDRMPWSNWSSVYAKERLPKDEAHRRELRQLQLAIFFQHFFFGWVSLAPFARGFNICILW